MNQIAQILELERSNGRQIHLYKADQYWLAFERSAFNLFSVYYVDSILKIKDSEDDSFLVAVIKRGTHGLLCNPRFSVLECSEKEILIDCRVTCGGFLHWKDSLVSLPATEESMYLTPHIPIRQSV